jgi:hypothetical protein
MFGYGSKATEEYCNYFVCKIEFVYGQFLQADCAVSSRTSHGGGQFWIWNFPTVHFSAASVPLEADQLFGL